MNLSRHWIRRIFFERAKATKTKVKELRKGSLLNSLTYSLQKILLSAAGISVITSPLMGQSLSVIKGIGPNTKINYNDANKTYTITTDKVSKNNAFNAFKNFTLHSNEIANLHLPSGTDNLLNFVDAKIDISGTVNAIKNSNIGGNLYFLSSKGLILHKGGVINAGAFYAMTPHEDVMTRILTDSGINLGNEEDIKNILEHNITNRNGKTYLTGITMAPDGEILIEGTINTLNGIGLYSGGHSKKDDTTGGIKIKNGAELNTLDTLAGVVNLEGITAGNVGLEKNAGNIEIVSLSDTQHDYDAVANYVTGYAQVGKLFTNDDVKKAYAEATVDVEAGSKVNSRKDVSIEAISTNGQLAVVQPKVRPQGYSYGSSFANVNSKINMYGTINAAGNVTLNSVADSNFSASGVTALNLGLTLLGMATPLNFNGYFSSIEVNTELNLNDKSSITAGKEIKLKSDSFSSFEAGFSTASIMTKKPGDSAAWLPSADAVFAWNDASSKLNVDGNILSKATSAADGKIEILSSSENRINVSSTCANDQADNPGIALAVGVGDNSALLNVNKNTNINTMGDINIKAYAENRPIIKAVGSVGNDSYGAVAVAVSDYTASAAVNVYGNITPASQVGSLTINALNNSYTNTLSAETSAGLDKLAQKIANNKSDLMGRIFQKVNIKDKHFMSFMQDSLPANSDKTWNAAGALGVANTEFYSKVYVEPSVKIETGGDLYINSDTNIEDLHMSVKTAGKSGCFDTDGNKSSYAAAVLWDDVVHKSDIIIDDSTSTKKGLIKGKRVTINSNVSVPYNRIGKMVEELEWAVEVLKINASGEKQKALLNNLYAAVKKIKDSAVTFASNKAFTSDSLSSFKDILLSLGVTFPAQLATFATEEISLVTSAIDIVQKAFDFASYNNYFNISASSGTSTSSDKGDSNSFAGSVILAYVDEKNNLLVGRNNVIQSTDTTADKNAININATNDSYVLTIAGTPLLSPVTGVNTLGGSFAYEEFNSVAETVIAQGTAIITDKANNTYIASSNNTDGAIAGLAASMGTSGFDGMAAYVSGDQHANVYIDDGVSLTSKKIDVNAYNDTEMTNVAGAVIVGKGKGVGVGLAINNLDKETQVLFGDYEKFWHDKRVDIGLAKQSEAYGGNVTATQTAHIFNAVTKTTGTINSIGVAGGITVKDDSDGEPGFFGKLINKLKGIGEWVDDKENALVDWGTQKLFSKLSLNDFNNIAENRAIPQAGQNPQAQAAPKFSMSLAGSAGINFIDNTTKTEIKNANFVLDGSKSSIDATAINSGHALSFAGAAAIMWQTATNPGNQNSTTVGLAGDAAVNSIENITIANIENSKIINANDVNITTINGGETIAAGLALEVAFNGENSKKAFSYTPEFSINLIDNTISATAKNNTINGGVDKKTPASSQPTYLADTNLNVTAYESDTQVEGGVSLNIGTKKCAAGTSIDIGIASNTLSADIIGGSYNNMGNVGATALQASTLVDAGLAVSAAISNEANRQGKKVAFTGVGAYNEINNTSTASIKNSVISAKGNVTAVSEDIKSDSDVAKPYESKLDRDDNDISFIDKEGKSYYDGINPATGTKKLSDITAEREGSLIVTTGVAVPMGGIPVGLGAAISDITNDFKVDIDSSDITSQRLVANANNKTVIYDIAVGAALSNQKNLGAGGGSAAWATIKNTAKTTIANSTFFLNDFDVVSANDAYIHSGAGQLAATAGGKGGVGAAFAFNSIDNTANSIIHGGSITGTDPNNSKINVFADNYGHIVDVAFSIAAGDKVDFAGTLTINELKNNSIAQIGDSSKKKITVSNFATTNVMATDSAQIFSLSGAIEGSKEGGIGGAVSVNTISGDTRTALENIDIDTKALNMKSFSDSENLAIAIGGGGAGKIAFDGASTANTIDRDVSADIASASIHNIYATVDAQAVSQAKTEGRAVVALGAGKVAIGAGVSVNRLYGEVSAVASKTTFIGKEFDIKAVSDQYISNVAVAGSAAGHTGISGSFGYNEIDYDTTAKIYKSNITASDSVAVVAQSDDSLMNYVGILGAGTTAGVGMSESTNFIDGDTKALVEDSTVIARGLDNTKKIRLSNSVDNSSMFDTFIEADTINIDDYLGKHRVSSGEMSGLIVDSSSTHTMKSFVAGIAGGGEGAGIGSVNVNMTDGETSAILKNSTVNKGYNGSSAGSINIHAGDYTNTAGFIGQIAISGTGALGVSADTNKVERDTYAKIDGLKAGSVAKDVKVNADSKQGISSVVAGIAGSAEASVAGNIDVGLSIATTTAEIINSKISLNSADVKANHRSRSHIIAGTGAVGLGTAGVGASVVVTNDKNHVNARISNSTVDINSGYAGDIKVNATNDDKFDTKTGAVGGGLYAGIAASVVVDYMENHVQAQVADSTIGSSANRANSIDIVASDSSNLITHGGSLGFGAGAVGAAVNVNTLDGNTKSELNNSKLYSNNNVSLTTTETRNGEQIGFSGQGGVGAVGATVLVVNSGKKFDLTDSGSKDVNEDTNKAIDNAKKAMEQNQVGKNKEMSQKEYDKIMSKDLNYVATADEKSVTATNILDSTVDSAYGKLITNTSTDGNIEMDCAGASAGLGAVMGTFGYIYDNKNVLTNVKNSTVDTNGIYFNSVANGTADMLMMQGSLGIGDYAGAFAFNKISGNTFVDIDKSNLKSKGRNIEIKAFDNAAIYTESDAGSFGGVAVGTIFAEAENDSKAVVNVGNTTMNIQGNSGTIAIAASRENEIEAQAYGIGVAVGAIDVVRPYAGDEGGSHINLKSGNTFSANLIDASIYDHQKLTSNLTCINGGAVGVAVGNVDAKEESRSDFIVNSGSKYLANTVNFSAKSDSEIESESDARTVSVVDIKANRAESQQYSTVNMEVAIASDTLKDNAIFNVSAENDASSKVVTTGFCGGVVSIANSKSTAIADLTTNVKVIQSGGTINLGELNVSSSSDATHNLYSNGDGGGLVNISPYSGQTYSKMEINNSIEMSGKITADKIRADAKSTTHSNSTAEAYQVSVLGGGSGTDVETVINLDTGIKISDNSDFNANLIELTSINDINTGYERNDHNVKGRGEGLISGTGDDSRQTINATSTITIAKGAKLTAEDILELEALTETNLKNSAVALGRGLGSHPNSSSKNTVILNNIINTENGSLLKTTEEDADIILATDYDFNTDYSAYTEVEGAGAGSTDAIVDYEFKLRNNININGSIYSFHDAKLFAGKNPDGSESRYNIKVSAEALTRSIIAWSTNAELDADITRENNINIGSTGKVETVEHTYMSAKAGDLNYNKHTKEYNWYRNDKDDTPVTTSGAGNKKENIYEKNAIVVDGSVTAGVHNKLNMTIDGTVNLHGDTLINGKKVAAKPTVECNNEQYKGEVKWGQKDYANKLYERYKEIEKLCADYAGTKVGLSYQAEKTRLKNEMLKYNLYDPKGDAVVGSLMIDYVEIPDMVGSGGNIYIEADDNSRITGKGTLQAKGAPEIVINNNTNMYMIVNDLKIEVPGGDIVLNDVGLGENAKTTLNQVTKVLTDSAKGSKIEVNENWKQSYDITYNQDGETHTLENYSPLTNIEINGNIRNEEGSVIVYNAKKDIILQGRTAHDTASINGASISLSAPNGSISQGYAQGITNVGYTPDIVLKAWAAAKETEISKGITATASKDLYASLSESELLKYVEEWKKQHPEEVDKSAGGVWIAGDEIYLNGDDLNINGLLQSGYADYKLTIENNSATQARINEIISKYNSNKNPEVTEAYLEQNCKLNESGMLWNESKGCYEYVVQAYFNPATNKIILEEVEAGGGKIYLTGRISNTGGGKILAADGAANINVDNKTSYDLETRLMDTGDREGLISITDLAKDKDSKGKSILGTLTEMRSSGTKTWYLTNGVAMDNPDVQTSSVASYYSPVAGLTYTWTTGYQTLDEYRHEESYKFLFWGGIDYGKETTDTLRERIEKNQITAKHLENIPLQIGSLVKTDVNLNGKEYNLNFNKYLNAEYGPETGGRTKYNTFFHASGTHYSWSVLKKGGIDSFQHSIKADYPIAIGFLKGNGNIGVSNVGNLTLTSDIVTKAGKVNLKSSGGSIEQNGGVIKADNVYLNAATGIGIENAINQKLTAKNGTLNATTNSGDVNLKINTASGNTSSELKLTAITNKGNVNVVSDTSLAAGGTNLDVKGDRINLESINGSIGKSNAALKIQAGQEIVKPGDTLSASINATALKDVSLNQTSGDMRIGKIISRTGDVYLTAAGSFIDALPSQGLELENKSAEELVAKWKELGIISQDGKSNAAEHKQQALMDYRNATSTSFNRYKDLDKYFTKNPKETGTDIYKEYQELKKAFGSYASADKWLDAQLKDKDSEWYALNNTVAYGWTQNELLYALQESIINRESGSSIDEKTKDDANIKGRNITLVAGNGIGRDDGQKIVDITNLQTDAGLETLKELSRTQASDIKWGFAGDKQDGKKATINYVNSICIDASGVLNATANGNVYLEDVAGNSINLSNVNAGKGNVRIFGKNGVYNSLAYNENGDTPINIKGKDLIIEGGSKSIGTKDKPVTTDMSGYVTARSEGLVNLRQAGNNNLIISAIYSGAEVMLRALNNIYSVYNGIQADELGYINSKAGYVSLLSDIADIGEANGKGLRVYLNENQKLVAEGNSVYIKGIGEGDLELTDITVRGGNLGIDSSKSDVTISTDISAKSADFNVKSLTQKSGRLTIDTMLTVAALNGINLPMMNNLISAANLYNKSNGDIKLYNSCSIDIANIANDAQDGNIVAYNFGSGDMSIAKASSKNSIFTGSDNGNLNINNVKANDIYYQNNKLGNAVDKNISAKTAYIYTDDGDSTLTSINANALYVENKNSGNINVTDELKTTENAYIFTNKGNIDLKTTTAGTNLSVVTYGGSITVDGDIKSTDSLKINAFSRSFGDGMALIDDGNIKLGDVTCINGHVEVAGHGDVDLKEVYAGKDVYLESYKKLSTDKIIAKGSSESLFSHVLSFLSTSISEIIIGSNLNAYFGENFINNIIETGGNLYLSVYNKLEINGHLKAEKSIDVISYGDGDQNIKSINSASDISIYNTNGNINLDYAFADGDITITSTDEGDINIDNELKTSNGGDLHISQKKGDTNIYGAIVDGDANITSEDGSINARYLEVAKDLEFRTQNGSIYVDKDIVIGRDAIFAANYGNTILKSLTIGSNLIIDAYYSAIIQEAIGQNSMIVNTIEGDIRASNIKLGQNLVANTEQGNIDITRLSVENNANITIDSPVGGDIIINNINVGKDFSGNLVVDSESTGKIKIENAEAGNKMIINGHGDVELRSAKTFGGLLEVKAGHDVVAECLDSAAKATVITMNGGIYIERIIARGILSIISLFGGDISVNNIETITSGDTVEYDGTIYVISSNGNVCINNATSTSNIFLSASGTVSLSNANAGNDIYLIGENSYTDAFNINANNDINIIGDNSELYLYDLIAGNDLNIIGNKSLGIFSNLNAGNNLNLISENSEFIAEKINVSKTINLELKLGNYSFKDVKTKNLSAVNDANTKLYNVYADNVEIDNTLSLELDKLNFNTIDILNNQGSELKAKNLVGNYLNLSNSGNAELDIDGVKDISMKNTDTGNIQATSIVSDSLDFVNDGFANISKITSGNANISNRKKGNLSLSELSASTLAFNNGGKANVSDIIADYALIDNANGGIFDAGKVKTSTLIIDNAGSSSINAIESENATINNNGKAWFADIGAGNSVINNYENGSLEAESIKTTTLTVNNSGTSSIAAIDSANAVINNSGKAKLTNVTGDNVVIDNGQDGLLYADKIMSPALIIKNAGALTIGTIDSANASINNNGKAKLTNVTGDKAVIDNAHSGFLEAENINSTAFILSNSGASAIAMIDSSDAEINNSGKAKFTNVIGDNAFIDNAQGGSLEAENLKSTALTMDNAGTSTIATIDSADVAINNSGLIKLTDVVADNAIIDNVQGGSLNAVNIKVPDLTIRNAGASNFGRIESDKPNINNTLSGRLYNTELIAHDSMNLENYGSASFNKINVRNATARNFGSTTVKESLYADYDFNLVTDKNGKFSFKNIETGNNLNIFADSGSLSGNSIKIGGSLYAYRYSDFGRMIRGSARASYTGNSIFDAILVSKKPADKFSLVIDKLEIANGLYVNNSGVEIKANVAVIGNDVNITADYEDINIKELAVDGGNLEINGQTGSVVLGTAVVDGNTSVKLEEGDFTANDLLAHDYINIDAGGSVASSKTIESEIGSINIRSGEDIDVENVNVSENSTVNLIADGNINAYRILAGQQGNIEAVNGDIIIGEINGKKLIFKEDTDNKTLEVTTMSVGDKLFAQAANIKIDEINHTAADKPLDIELSGVGGAMDNVTISNVKTQTGVDLNGLFSHYADIHVSNRYFSLSKVYLLRNGNLSNSDTNFRLFGWKPEYSSNSDIIAYFVPNSRNQWANIEFIDMGQIGKKPYIVLSAKDGFNRMFDEYTVVQQIDAISDDFLDLHKMYMASYLDSFNLRNEFEDSIGNYKISSDDEDEKLTLTSAGELIH